MGVFASTDDPVSTGHEQVVFCQDKQSGLKAIIGIYSTALGPALGGTRFYPYATEADALADVLDLSRGMAYKNALANLDLGGGKAVIWGDPEQIKSEALLRAYGRFVESLNGRYYTACDVGTYVADMDVIARETRYVTGRSVEHGGAGDSSILTAWGVFQGMRAAAEHVWGSPTLAGRRVGVAGLGKVGKYLTAHLLDDGAEVVATDVNPRALEWARATHPQVTLVDDTAALVASDIDVYAPCALGGALNDETVPVLRAKVVTGAANNQLAHSGIEKVLADRGILYTPDYVVNAGGVIQVADEIEGFNFERAKLRATRIFDTTRQILQLADDEGVPPAVAADRLAERRMAEVGRLRAIHLR
ncbi:MULTISPECIES: Glu/Leu/Phe/Val dehydrogenase [Micromonospora]|uniref:Glu/Leu/Phe/Val family dehydrogenase n=1 Tax=Micromonospora TaxID=1873 RepID=UPI0003EEDD6E|nr:MULTISPECIES: Glu/Leu/Phe/Val dehydrogenase [unclassified Micromonospora]EWM66603.1 valine dehydrogenase ValDH [Micromonospora sp. M42]MBQ1062765.1 Glu/Leu/Phe/Val dehydrogenase [Micromonospora sp. C41]MCK1808135.1 Glu/Leu/Phe/Val dehydrogenase [Micromonospora sp. R42106]MCK1830921.1 Glu/Leu/Phe/Val dehydrogenase [Micromonospora sp. R42003]MCK1844407.1 Glu/Leu/Phe/Val dehydrogenase [Micromonospora sp. R42004]